MKKTICEMKPSEYLCLPYSRLIIASQPSGFSGRILEFPGCYSRGETIEEASRNLEDAAESWIMAAQNQCLSIPEPRGGNEYSGRFVLRLPRTLHESYALRAQVEGISLNQLLVYVLAKNI